MFVMNISGSTPQSWYYTATGLAWDECLKITNQTLMPLPDLGMVHMIEKGIHGGVAMAVTRYAGANNKCMKNWQKSLPSVFLAYFDANNLYSGYAMSQKLPTDVFAWVTGKALENALETKLWRTQPGFYEVNIHVSERLHDYFNDFPIAPERRMRNGVEKLITSLDDKEKYVIHHEALKFIDEMGYEITAVHRVITFNESAWMTLM